MQTCLHVLKFSLKSEDSRQVHPNKLLLLPICKIFLTEKFFQFILKIEYIDLFLNINIYLLFVLLFFFFKMVYLLLKFGRK